MLRQSYINIYIYIYTYIYIRRLKSLLKDIILGYPTWFSCQNWVVKTIVPLPRSYQIVILQALVGLKKAGYQSNNIRLRLEVISRAGKGMALIHVNDVVLCEPQIHLIVQGIYTPQDSKQIGSALIGTQPMIEQVVSGYPSYWKCHSSLYESDHWNNNFTLLSICKYLVRRTIL